ncbi:MAG TPA: hypothetical protein ACFYEJ_00505 [Candidatus Wujingus californicus]|uniref:hypothetical protein n=1 Tax=Candidatus Wujingus californicus TaxID=3367618 RepID=UPI004027E8ED
MITNFNRLILFLWIFKEFSDGRRFVPLVASYKSELKGMHYMCALSDKRHTGKKYLNSLECFEITSKIIKNINEVRTTPFLRGIVYAPPFNRQLPIEISEHSNNLEIYARKCLT